MRYFIFLLAIISFPACKTETKTAERTQDIYYTCSMDPQVIEYKPGKCPICHMELTQVKKTNGTDKDEIHLSDQQVQLGNIQTDTIREGSIGDQIVLTGTLTFDQLKTSSVSSRVMGRIETLYFKNIGDYIRKGTALYDLYSEELNNSKQEYLLALEQKTTFTNETAIDFDQLLRSAKNKLLLWGMSEAQITDLSTTAMPSPSAATTRSTCCGATWA